MKNKKLSVSQSRARSRGEFDFVERVRKRAQGHSRYPDTSLQIGIGDDAAVIEQRSGRDSVITTDLLVEEIDFHLHTTTPRFLGHKALAVSLSDLAAMGARPRYALLSIGVPQRIWNSDFVDEFYEGFFALAKSYNVELIGGDVSRTPERVVIDSIVIGDAARRKTVRRSGAKSGDQIFVTGSLGGAAAGLQLLDKGARLRTKARGTKSSRASNDLLLRQLRPDPRIEWGLSLSQPRLATAMIDISDGLSSDLNHLCRESKVGAVLDQSLIPVDPSIFEISKGLKLDPLQLALHGGEDFELLFTVRPRRAKSLPKEVGKIRATYIGDITADAGRITLIDGATVRDLEPQGFTHFRE